ncbi:MAG: inosine/xanthosine triphosphatase [Anaerolineales bacterium]|nr:inosine/xanthosine triphosphatase [Anaerolineales bacterium]
MEPTIIIVASSNPVKLEAVSGAFKKVFPKSRFSLESVQVSSGVASQPNGDEDTMQGAFNRVSAAAALRPEADFWVGIEGGISDTPEGMLAFAWIVIRSPGMVGRSRTASFYLPDAVAEHVRSGFELGVADDIVFNQSDSKRKNGAIGILTENVITRADLYEHAAIMALIPFLQTDFYPPPQA